LEFSDSKLSAVSPEPDNCFCKTCSTYMRLDEKLHRASSQNLKYFSSSRVVPRFSHSGQ
jgi:hypothetical protein